MGRGKSLNGEMMVRGRCNVDDRGGSVKVLGFDAFHKGFQHLMQIFFLAWS